MARFTLLTLLLDSLEFQSLDNLSQRVNEASCWHKFVLCGVCVENFPTLKTMKTELFAKEVSKVLMAAGNEN